MLGALALLLVAIFTEVLATASLPRTQGFRDPLWSLIVVAGYTLSIYLLSVVVRQIPVSVAYAVWSGIGTAAIAVIGFTFLGEELDAVKVISLAMIVAGVVVLNLHSAH